MPQKIEVSIGSRDSRLKLRLRIIEASASIMNVGERISRGAGRSPRGAGGGLDGPGRVEQGHVHAWLDHRHPRPNADPATDPIVHSSSNLKNGSTEAYPISNLQNNSTEAYLSPSCSSQHPHDSLGTFRNYSVTAHADLDKPSLYDGE